MAQHAANEEMQEIIRTVDMTALLRWLIEQAQSGQVEIAMDWNVGDFGDDAGGPGANVDFGTWISAAQIADFGHLPKALG